MVRGISAQVEQVAPAACPSKEPPNFGALGPPHPPPDCSVFGRCRGRSPNWELAQSCISSLCPTCPNKKQSCFPSPSRSVSNHRLSSKRHRHLPLNRASSRFAVYPYPPKPPPPRDDLLALALCRRVERGQAPAKTLDIKPSTPTPFTHCLTRTRTSPSRLPRQRQQHCHLLQHAAIAFFSATRPRSTTCSVHDDPSLKLLVALLNLIV